MREDFYTNTVEDAADFARHYGDDFDDRPSLSDVDDYDYHPGAPARPSRTAGPDVVFTDPWAVPAAPVPAAAS